MTLLRIAVLAMVLGWANVAGAVVFREAGFSIEVRGAQVCLFTPVALRDAAECEGLDVPATASSDVAALGETVHATGILREPGTKRFLGMFQVMQGTGPEAWPDQAAATAFSEKWARDMVASLPPTAKLHAGTAHVETIGETRVVRTTLQIDGWPPESPLQRVLEHQEVSAIFTRTGRYVVAFSGARADAAALKAISERSIATVALDADLRPGKDVSALLGQVMVLTAMVVAAVAAVLSHRKSSRREAQRRLGAMPPAASATETPPRV